jgi:hypothetical protein
VAKKALDWSEHELYRHLALLQAEDDSGDAFQLGYNLLIQRRFRGDALKSSIVRTALTALFAAQLKSGLWEKKEPLFRYEEHGDAYPFTFELLTATLRAFDRSETLLVPHEANLERTVSWVDRNAAGDPPLWRSGHLASNDEPESWATAEVYYFLQLYRAYLARRILLVTMGDSASGKVATVPDPEAFARLYQPEVKLPKNGAAVLFGSLLKERVLDPLRTSSHVPLFTLARNPRRRDLLRSGILFGPSGTGKTTYAKAMANYLGWPLLTINPSDFAAEGLLLIPTVGARLFERLLELEDTVIFFDEMEELMRRRDKRGGADFEQRFLTTSFLPHLQSLRDQATCIYIVATNNFESLDDAARAPRRFDFQVQIRPPSFDEKLRLMSVEFFSGELPAAVSDELERNRDAITLATLREARVLSAELAARPTQAREILESFVPSLAKQKKLMDREEGQNSFALSA